MKKTISSLLAASVLMLALLCVSALADGSVNVTVTVANGELLLAAETVIVTDLDGDGVLTINDALAAAHEANCPDGADGYASENTMYGLSITKLWGVENGGAYGYYLNNASPMSVADEIHDGDTVCAFVYTDTVNYGDVYSFFEQSVYQSALGDYVTLKLLSCGFDENWQSVTLAVEGAEIIVNGNATGIYTDANGEAVVHVDGALSSVTAVSATQTLVPPVCRIVAHEEASAPATGDNGIIMLFVVASLAAAGAVSLKKR